MYDVTGIRNVAWDGIALEAAQFKKMEKSDFLVFVIVVLYCFKQSSRIALKKNYSKNFVKFRETTTCNETRFWRILSLIDFIINTIMPGVHKAANKLATFNERFLTCV